MDRTIINIKLDNIIYERINKISNQNNCTKDLLIQKAICYYLDILNKKNSNNISILKNKKETNITSKKENKKNNKTLYLIEDKTLSQSIARNKITSFWYISETKIIPYLLKKINHSESMIKSIQILSSKLAHILRYKKDSSGSSKLIQDLLQEFSLSSKEGTALMCLSESLLRIPDSSTRDSLIKDKIRNGNWKSHINNSKSIFVNLATWGLVFTKKLIISQDKDNFLKLLKKLTIKWGEPLIRKGMDIAIQLIGKQFVSGENINEALSNGCKLEKDGFCYSYDMLGEEALTEEDANTYLTLYQNAIHEIGKRSKGLGIYEGPGISIKLSALHPRYCRTQKERVMLELYPRLLNLTLLSKKYDIGLNIDAEEADRLEISIDLLTKLCFEPKLYGWNGIGFVVQAYQKRCIKVIDELIDIAKKTNRRIMVRLVKGAYWDSEIKKAQIEGLEDYPVFTRKYYTDLSYLVSAKKLLSVPNYIYPQFATHNAHTVSSIYHFAGKNYYSGQYEFQCLHGMGESLYKEVVGKISDGKLNRKCRIYAPVGTYKTLLSYLVRRLLENGANTSFVNRIADKNISLNQLISDPILEIIKISKQEGTIGLSHPKILLPKNIYHYDRNNSKGINISNENCLISLLKSLNKIKNKIWKVKPIISSIKTNKRLTYKIYNPANNLDLVGECQHSSIEDVKQALSTSFEYIKIWSLINSYDRALILQKAANNFELKMHFFIGLLIRESGKSISNAISEVRETIDFLRYYAFQIKQDPKINNYSSLGSIVCISPWNFPLAIFVGQISAALAAGNTVLAKPAEQTPLIAFEAVKLMINSGIPKEALQLLPGKGKIIGLELISDSRIGGVIFTGSTQVAKLIYKIVSKHLNVKEKLIPLIAETGGINAMIVDSSALIEQVVKDIINSAFDSCGQRCSALRILCIQNDIADQTLHMLKGAASEYIIGDPSNINTDIGPVINLNSKESIINHISYFRKLGYPVWQANKFNLNNYNKNGTFIPLTIIELNDFDDIKKEIFGPVLHVVRYNKDNLNIIINKINKSGYGLTLGLHTRINKTIEFVTNKVNVGNIYINRNMIGAVVGVQPFGGEGLSGTGPKAGGPLYLYRLLSRNKETSVLSSLNIIDKTKKPDITEKNKLQKTYIIFSYWIKKYYPSIYPNYINMGKISQSGIVRVLSGPTGEINNYKLLSRKKILCFSNNNTDLIIQLMAVISIGSKAVLISSEDKLKIFSTLPKDIKKYVYIINNLNKNNIKFDAVLFHGKSNELIYLMQKISSYHGPIIPIYNYSSGDTNIELEKLLIEKSISINTAAVGGNIDLFDLN